MYDHPRRSGGAPAHPAPPRLPPAKNDLLLTALVRRHSRIVARFEAELPRPGSATVEENLRAHPE